MPDDLKIQQKRGLKTARIPIKVVASEPLRKPEWIRVRAGGGERFTEIKRILREKKLHTVWRFPSRRIFLISVKRSPPPARTRIHSGLRSGSEGTTLIGMRAVLRPRFCWIFSSESGISAGVE